MVQSHDSVFRAEPYVSAAARPIMIVGERVFLTPMERAGEPQEIRPQPKFGEICDRR